MWLKLKAIPVVEKACIICATYTYGSTLLEITWTNGIKTSTFQLKVEKEEKSSRKCLVIASLKLLE